MKKSRFSDSQIMDVLKRVDAGLGVPDVCRELGISTATFYKWRAKYGGMDVSMMSRLKELEEENRRLKKMYLEEKLKAEIVAERRLTKSSNKMKIGASVLLGDEDEEVEVHGEPDCGDLGRGRRWVTCG